METSSSGTYWNLSLGINDSIAYRYINAVGVNEWEEVVSVFPNPSEGKFIVDMPVEWGSVQTEIIDIKGQVIFQERIIGKKEFDLSYLAKGIYLLEVRTNDLMVYKKKIILN